MNTSTDPRWSDEEQQLVVWFERCAVFLPQQPYDLSPYEKVVDPALFYRGLRRDIAAGPGSPRHPGLIADLQKLRDRFGDVRPEQQPKRQQTLIEPD